MWSMRAPTGNPVLKVRERKTRAIGLPGDLMSTREVATVLGCHIQTVRERIKRGGLQEYRFGGLRRVSLAEVLAQSEAEQGKRMRPVPKHIAKRKASQQ